MKITIEATPKQWNELVMLLYGTIEDQEFLENGASEDVLAETEPIKKRAEKWIARIEEAVE